MVEDRSRDYMNARRVSKEYEVVTRGLNRNLPSVTPKNTPEEATQVLIEALKLFSVKKWVIFTFTFYSVVMNK